MSDSGNVSDWLKLWLRISVVRESGSNGNARLNRPSPKCNVIKELGKAGNVRVNLDPRCSDVNVDGKVGKS